MNNIYDELELYNKEDKNYKKISEELINNRNTN